MRSQLLSKIRTTDERDRLSVEIDLLLDSIFQTGALERVLAGKIRLWVADIVRNEIPKEESQLEGYLKNIKADLEKMKVLSVTMPFEPTDISVDKFHDFIRKEIGEDIILSYEYDPAILGGALIKWAGEYRDFSLRRLFEEEFDVKSKEVLKIMYTK